MAPAAAACRGLAWPLVRLPARSQSSVPPGANRVVASTSACGRWERAAPSRGTTAAGTETPPERRASTVSAGSGLIRSSATARWVSRTIGSMSRESSWQPGEGAVIGLRPQGEERGLAVPGRSDRGNGRHSPSGAQPGEELRPGDHAETDGGRVQLRIQDLDRESSQVRRPGQSRHRSSAVGLSGHQNLWSS
jgi:hypothetical protein